MIRLKTPKQIEGIRESARILSVVLREVVQQVAPGVTPIHLDMLAAERIRAFGARASFLGYNGFPATLCVSVDNAVIHGIPDHNRLHAGQIIGIDCGVEWNGYYSDAAITVPVGTISGDLHMLLETTRTSLYLGIEQARSGKRISDISKAIFNCLNRNGYGIVRDYCGHGVGYAIHEAPEIPNYLFHGPNARLQPGMVLAIEPMVTMGSGAINVLDDQWTVVTADNVPAAHFEHTIAIFENHTEILTNW